MQHSLKYLLPDSLQKSFLMPNLQQYFLNLDHTLILLSVWYVKSIYTIIYFVFLNQHLKT